VPLSGTPSEIDNPRDASGAWFSHDSTVVAWNIAISPVGFINCPAPIIVATSSGTNIWQVPGNVINAIAVGVSTDGRRVAFDGTYKPNGAFLNTSENRRHWITGLQIADMATNSVSLIVPRKDSFDGTQAESGVGWISWAPDGNEFVYDFGGEIYVYKVSSKITTPLARGANPVWSPDGKWIGFRSPDSEATIIDPKTIESRKLIPGRKILWGIHWSPDSQYFLFGELRSGFIPFVTTSTQLVVYRVRDAATEVIYRFGYTEPRTDQGFSWVRNAEKFLQAARRPPKIMPCDKPNG
jgi:hypothetical protein